MRIFATWWPMSTMGPVFSWVIVEVSFLSCQTKSPAREKWKNKTWQRIPKRFCLKFHRGVICPRCSFKHWCFRCGNSHPVFKCQQSYSKLPAGNYQVLIQTILLPTAASPTNRSTLNPSQIWEPRSVLQCLSGGFSLAFTIWLCYTVLWQHAFVLLRCSP